MLDESDGVLTNELSGRTINKIYRKGKILEIQCFDGHVINIMADNNGDIRFYSKSVKVSLQSLPIFGGLGRF